MPEIIKREAVYLWYYFSVQLEQLFPYWVLGMVIGSAVSVFLKDRIHDTFRALGEKKLGILGIIAASFLGVASPLCMYGTIPIAASFSRSGIKDDWLAAFMMSYPFKPSVDPIQRRPGNGGLDSADPFLLSVRDSGRIAGAYLLFRQILFQLQRL